MKHFLVYPLLALLACRSRRTQGFRAVPPSSRAPVVPSASSTSTRLPSSTAEDETATSDPASLGGPPAISVRDVTCSFDGGGTYQLDSATFNLLRGGRVGLVGRYAHGGGKCPDDAPFLTSCRARSLRS